jgi:hypothetical protein
MDIRLARIDAAREIYAALACGCIFLSANLDAATRYALAPCEPIDFIDKPVLPGLLRRALQRAGRLHKADIQLTLSNVRYWE